MTQVHIELQRVQTWLFAVPRLRAMVGANTLLGEALRISLPALARETGRSWSLASAQGAYPSADPQDPLRAHDDPATDAADGILSRDGGHFEAEFSSGADEFADAATSLLRSSLPGLRFRVSVEGVERQQAQVHVSTELPVLMPCEWTGRGLASATIEQGSDRPAVSLDVARRHKAAKTSEDGTARDVATLLTATTTLQSLTRPQELEDLVGSGYLAVIHADGNNVGKGRPDNPPGAARFFHCNRVLLRRALQTAIDAHSPASGRYPILPLMLGGDDLLIVSRADVALPFVVTLCDALGGLQVGSADFKLTLGVGVVLAKHTIPIHRLHEVAEQLAASAKLRFRGLNEPRSVVDWAVYSTAWVDDPQDVRRRDWIRGNGAERRVLSQRPVDVLGGGLDTLAGLVSGAEELKDAPRSQLRYLVEQLPRGRALSELAFKELSTETKAALKRAEVSEVWRSAGSEKITPLLDLVEVAEIANLGRNSDQSDKRDAPWEATHV